MAGTTTTHLFDCTPEELFHIITDYENYSDFLQEIKRCEIIKEVGNKKLVEYQVSVIKSFTYRLWMTEDWENYTVSWEFDSGDLFRKSVGSWRLTQEGDKTKATYSVEAKMKMLVPGTITKMLVNVNLPAMMKAYEKRLTEVTYE